MEKENKKIEYCCICREKATMYCPDCKNSYCEKHYESVVLSGNCCAENEKCFGDYNY